VSQQNVAIVRRLFDAAMRGDTETALSLWDPDVEFDARRSRWAEVMPGMTHFRGHDGLRAFFREYYETWEKLVDDVEELIDAGDQVVSVVTHRGRGRTSGLDVEWAGNSGVWTVRSGKIVRVVWFPTREEALAATEVSDQGLEPGR
jgi:ketosteroid isomerase-like protein